MCKAINDFKYVGEQFDGNSGLYYDRHVGMRAKWGCSGGYSFEGDPQTQWSLRRYLLAFESFEGDTPDLVSYCSTSTWAGAVTYIPHPNTKALIGAAAGIAAFAAAHEIAGIASQLGGRALALSTRYLISGLAEARESAILLGFGF